MARGFESKSVADQQEAHEAEPHVRDPGDPGIVNKRRNLELALADVRNRLETASSDGHREMLRRALEAIEKQLGE